MKHTRRNALKTIIYSGTGIALSTTLQARLKKLPRSIKLGVITDTHIGFVPKAEDRLTAFLNEMQKIKPDGLIQMGDFAYPNQANQKHVDRFNQAHKNVIHAIGNHELDHKLTREDAKKSWGIPGYYYTKEIEGIKIIVLDGNDRGSPTYKSHGGYHKYIGKEQREWLSEELKSSESPVFIISHQPLAGSGSVDNATEIQKILEPHKDKIILCLNGHSHLDQHLEINGINYLHINSASYYWLGGKVRLAQYKDPLFTTMTIDAQKGSVDFSSSISTWAKGTPEDAGYFKNGKRDAIKQHVVPKISARSFTPTALKP